MSLSGGVQIFASDIYKDSSSQEHPLGTLGQSKDGRLFRYIKAGAVALSPGKVCVPSAMVANHENISVASAAAVGASEVTVTLGATAATANQYADGYLVINNDAGEGIAYAISSHPAADSAASLKLKLDESVQVALTTASDVTLLANPWAGVLISVADQGDMACGVPNVAITAAQYGWAQSHGVCACLADETIAIGSAVTLGSSTVGAFETKDVDDAFPEYGYAVQAGVDAEYRALFLTID